MDEHAHRGVNVSKPLPCFRNNQTMQGFKTLLGLRKKSLSMNATASASVCGFPVSERGFRSNALAMPAL